MISLFKISLKSNIPLLSLRMVHKIDYFLCHNSILNSTMTRNETTIKGTNKLIKEGTKPLNNNLGNDLVDNITQAYRFEVLEMFRMVNFWNKNNKSFNNLILIESIFESIMN